VVNSIFSPNHSFNMTQFTNPLPQWGNRAFVALAFLCLSFRAFAQTYITGTVKDDKEALIGAAVKVLKDNVFVRAGITDYDGNFRIVVDPGTYDVEVSYTGYQTQRITNVTALADKLNTLPDIIMANAILSEVVITAYRVPLIEQDHTSSGTTLLTSDMHRSQAARKSASRSAKKSAGKSAKPRPIAKPAPVTIKGSRSLAGKKAKASKKEEHGVHDDYNTGQYQTIVENPFQDAKLNNISTFSIDVDAAAYANVRRHLNSRSLPPKDAVRLEEMINYFDYKYQTPAGEHPFEVNTEVAPCPWNPQNRLMLIGIQGAVMDVGQLPASNLVFLIDVSGSMQGDDRLGLVKRSLEMLTDQLRPNDRVAMVVYAGAAGVVLESTSGTDKATIKAALGKLTAGGSTAGGAGIKLAYEIARKYFVHGGNNRVILCTDGDFNVGTSSDAELVKMIEEERKSGVYLTVLGYGMGNYQDGKNAATGR
jgi:Ca-activated chloride channel family protein